MKTTIFACPCCFKPLKKNLKCTCGFAGSFLDGKYHLHRSDPSWDFCLKQNGASRRAAEGAKTKPTLGGTYSQQDKEHSLNVHNALQAEIEKYIPSSPGLFLELGVGGGVWHRTLLDLGWVGYLLDIDGDNLSSSKSNCVSVVGDGYYLPFVDDCFDIVFDRAALHHFENLNMVLTQINRVLKPGAAYVSVGNPSCLENEVDAANIRHKDMMDDYGLLETMPTKREYEKSFSETFGNFIFIPVLDNSLMNANKEMRQVQG